MLYIPAWLLSVSIAAAAPVPAHAPVPAGKAVANAVKPVEPAPFPVGSVASDSPAILRHQIFQVDDLEGDFCSDEAKAPFLQAGTFVTDKVFQRKVVRNGQSVQVVASLQPYEGLLSKDGRWLTTAGDDAMVIDVTTGLALPRNFEAKGMVVAKGASPISNNGRFLGFRTNHEADGRAHGVMLYDAEKQSWRLVEVPGIEFGPNWVSDDGRFITPKFQGRLQREYRVFDTKTGKQLPIPQLSHGSAITASADGGKLAALTRDPREIVVFDVKTNAIVRRLSQDGVETDSPSLSPDGSLLYVPSRTAGQPLKVTILEVATGKPVATPSMLDDCDITVCSNGRIVAKKRLQESKANGPGGEKPTLFEVRVIDPRRMLLGDNPLGGSPERLVEDAASGDAAKAYPALLQLRYTHTSAADAQKLIAARKAKPLPEKVTALLLAPTLENELSADEFNVRSAAEKLLKSAITETNDLGYREKIRPALASLISTTQILQVRHTLDTLLRAGDRRWPTLSADELAARLSVLDAK